MVTSTARAKRSRFEYGLLADSTDATVLVPFADASADSVPWNSSLADEASQNTFPYLPLTAPSEPRRSTITATLFANRRGRCEEWNVLTHENHGEQRQDDVGATGGIHGSREFDTTCSGQTWLDRWLCVFTEVQSVEGTGALLLAANVFCLLACTTC